MNSIVGAISDFIFVENQPEVSDMIFVVGGSHPESGEKAAQLWKNGYAPLCFVGGGVSIKTGKFPGPKSKADLYNKDYKTEFDFFVDVLLKNGVDKTAILGENRSSFTRQNAEFAKAACDQLNLTLKKAILVCKRFHARRALMFFQAAFPETSLTVVPIDCYDITKENWYQTPYGVQRVLGELRRCGDQFNFTDISHYKK